MFLPLSLRDLLRQGISKLILFSLLKFEFLRVKVNEAVLNSVECNFRLNVLLNERAVRALVNRKLSSALPRRDLPPWIYRHLQRIRLLWHRSVTLILRGTSTLHLWHSHHLIAKAARLPILIHHAVLEIAGIPLNGVLVVLKDSCVVGVSDGVATII